MRRPSIVFALGALGGGVYCRETGGRRDEEEAEEDEEEEEGA